MNVVENIFILIHILYHSELMAEAMKGESEVDGGANTVYRTHDKTCNCPHSMRAQRLLTVRRMLVSIYFQSMSSDKGEYLFCGTVVRFIIKIIVVLYAAK